MVQNLLLPMQNIYIYNFVNGFGLVQGILLCVVILFYPGGNRSTNKFLAGHVLFVSLALAAPFCQQWFQAITPRADRFIEPLLLLIFPCLFLYVKSFSEHIKPATVWLHCIPFFLFTPLVALSLVYRTDLLRWNTAFFTCDFTLLVFVLIKAILFGVYLYLCWKEIDRIQHLVKDQFSEISRINLRWAKQLLLAGAGLLAVYFAVMLLIVSDPSLARLNFLLVALLTAYIYFASFKGLTQPAIFKNREDPVTGEITVQAGFPDRAKYRRSALPEIRLEEIMVRLKALMTEDRLFLEPELTIQMLGEKLDVSPYYISQVLSQKLKQNFYDFVNGYRVEEAKKLLRNPSHENFTLLSIAFDSGFNSKTTFNTVFKKFTTQTPSAFKSQLAG